jgi:4-hydroxyphenylacetate 3-monooxygenase
VAAIVEGMVLASEAASVRHPSGVEMPNPRFLYGAMGLQSELYPRVLELVRELAGGGVIQQPSSYRELLGEETSGDMARYLQSSSESAEDRVKLFKLAWDAVGSEFGSRHHQYEMFYAGAPFVVRGYAYRNYGYDEVVREVEEFLAGYDLSAEVPTMSGTAPGAPEVRT